ncbi:cell division protein PerM [Rathayibacter sp. CAU 1779]
MNRLTVILLAALDAVIALGVGVAIPLVPLTVLWALKLDLAADWVPFWRAAADIWLLGHGTDVTITLAPAASALFGLSGTNVFPITIAALGFALLTVLLGSRTGRRAWATPHPVTAAIAAVVVFAVLSGLVTISAHSGSVIPSLLQGTLLPPAVFAIGIGIGMIAGVLRDSNDPTRAEHPVSDRGAVLPWPVVNWSPSTRAVLASGLRAGVAAALLLIAAAAVVLAVLMAVRYGRIVGLYETLQPGILGAGALTLAQLALLPNAVSWTASWLAGPGFAVGTGSSVDVTQTTLGPLPSVPILGALPQGDPGFGLIAVLVPVLCGAAAGFLTRQRLERMPAPRTPSSRASSAAWGVGRLTLITLCAAVTSGAIVGLLAWWSAGSIGPGRLHDAGPNPLLVAGVFAVEALVGCAIGVAIRRQPDEDAVRLSLRERRAASSTDVVAPVRPSGPSRQPTPVPVGVAVGAGAKRREADENLRKALAWYDPDAMDDDLSDDLSDDLEDRRPGAGPVPKRTPREEFDTEPVPVVSRDRKKGDRRRGDSSRQDVTAHPSASARPSGAGSLARPAAPRVPTPRGRLPRVYQKQDFAGPDFARHEDTDRDRDPDPALDESKPAPRTRKSGNRGTEGRQG